MNIWFWPRGNVSIKVMQLSSAVCGFGAVPFHEKISILVFGWLGFFHSGSGKPFRIFSKVGVPCCLEFSCLCICSKKAVLANVHCYYLIILCEIRVTCSALTASNNSFVVLFKMNMKWIASINTTTTAAFTNTTTLIDSDPHNSNEISGNLSRIIHLVECKGV